MPGKDVLHLDEFLFVEPTYPKTPLENSEADRIRPRVTNIYMEDSRNAWSIHIDTGGTFTDCIAIDPTGSRKMVKVLSNSTLRGELVSQVSRSVYKVRQSWSAPDNFIKGFTFRQLGCGKEIFTVVDFNASRSLITLSKPLKEGWKQKRSFEVVTGEEAPVLAARLATQTPPEEPLPPIHLRLATTKGTNALLERKGQPVVLFMTKGYKDLLKIGTQQRPELFTFHIKKTPAIYEKVIEVNERLNSEGSILKALTLKGEELDIEELTSNEVTSAAIALMHSYKNGKHEQELKEWLEAKGFTHVSLSSELSPHIGIITRAETTLTNAYLAPVIQEYLDSVQQTVAISQGSVFIMTSAGGLSSADRYHPKDSLLSGPAGGVVGAAFEARKIGFKQVISFDMGGTSTDVARYDGDYEYMFEHRVGDVRLATPALSIETVAAGGGSICWFDGHKLCVGPDSAGAFPGPACYGAGGPLTITDVNLLLGRLDSQNFHIPVERKASEQKLREIVKGIERSTGEQTTDKAILFGFLDIANERMAGAIQRISIQKGYDTREYALVAFGGAGGQHACAVARRLGIHRIIIPDEAGLLSATGLGNAVIEEFAEQQVLQPLQELDGVLRDMIQKLTIKALTKLRQASNNSGNVEVRRRILSLRLEGQENSLDVEYIDGFNPEKAFREVYKQRYGHWISDRTIELESVRVVASTMNPSGPSVSVPETDRRPKSSRSRPIWFKGSQARTSVFSREDLQPGDLIGGPALILDPYSTIVLEPDWQVHVCENNALVMELAETSVSTVNNNHPEAARLELFTNRFSSIAGEMGSMLRRIALSVNVKDRLDFSCALLNTKGELVVNAPHIPVHLGALGLCVRRLIESIPMQPGDVVVTNHPAFGGSHLPDVTVVTPIFTEDEQLAGYAASRAHHAEIGGTTPGSMPPTATSLIEEGVVISPMYLIHQGEEQWHLIRKHLKKAPWPTRNVEENLADLRAAVAANHRGAEGLRMMVRKYGLQEVKKYMNALKEHAGLKMRETIKNITNGTYTSEELLDDGTPLKITVKVHNEVITIDFTGTGEVHPRNLNATPAIVNSVVMYVLRLLVDEPLPLNEGLLEPVRLILPTCLLNPGFDKDPAACPAVVGGNTEVSQRLVDTLLKPFERVACSQGTMNNVLFGNDRFGYYETVGGGTGAGPGFDGADAIHHHMTNTRATDPEILEHRYPVRLDRYAVRKDSGGGGVYIGGSGIIREITFLEPVHLTILTQHRVERPYGLRGGERGQPGEQWVIYNEGRKEKLSPTDGRDLRKGDRFILKTPGGGGFGKPDDVSQRGGEGEIRIS